MTPRNTPASTKVGISWLVNTPWPAATICRNGVYPKASNRHPPSMAHDPKLCKKVYLVEDCTSPVVVPGVIDFTDQANAAFARFQQAGMHVVKSTDPIDTWPGVEL